eukprot:3259636-Rhodomonas_salina.2
MNWQLTFHAPPMLHPALPQTPAPLPINPPQPACGQLSPERNSRPILSGPGSRSESEESMRESQKGFAGKWNVAGAKSIKHQEAQSQERLLEKMARSPGLS